MQRLLDVQSTHALLLATVTVRERPRSRLDFNRTADQSTHAMDYSPLDKFV